MSDLSAFSLAEKIDAVELEIVRRKRMFGPKPEPHKQRQIDVLRAVALDLRAQVEPMERTDGLRGDDERPGRAVEG